MVIIMVSFAGRHYAGVKLQTCVKNATTVLFLKFFSVAHFFRLYIITRLGHHSEEVGHATNV